MKIENYEKMILDSLAGKITSEESVRNEMLIKFTLRKFFADAKEFICDNIDGQFLTGNDVKEVIMEINVQ